MPEENPNLDIPLDKEGEISTETDGKSELSLEEIEAEINRRNAEKEFEKEKDPNVVDPLEIDPKDKPPVEPPEETQPDPRFKGKTAEELVAMFSNLEKLQRAQTNELGTLRKENKDFKDKEEASQSLNLKEIEKKIMPEIEKWAPEKRATWFKLFNEEPEVAMAQVVKVVIEPLTRKTALNSNEKEVTRLVGLHKGDVVPYQEKEVNALIAANEGWWQQYGTQIFEHAYDVFRNSNFDKFATIREEGIKTKEKEKTAKEEEIKNQTFVEGQKPVKIIQGKKEITHQQIKDEEPEVAMAVIKRELLKRGVKVDD